MQAILHFVVILVVLLGMSCDRSVIQGIAETNSTLKALDVDPSVAQLSATFPDRVTFVSRITGQVGTPTWVCEMPLFQRYRLTVEMDLARNAEGKLRPATPLRGQLIEWTKIEPHKSGQVSAVGGKSWQLDEKQLTQLCAAGGDFSVLGIDLIKDQPVPNFNRILTQK